MAGFIFEKHLPHQEKGVKAVLDVFDNAEVIHTTDATSRLLSNPQIQITKSNFELAIKDIHKRNDIDHTGDHFNAGSPVLDISMETGTGKTYTYTKTMYDLNRTLGLNKFIIVVPTLSIKAGTVNFLKSEALKEHFREDYDGREIKTYVVESQKKKGKNKKSFMPQSVHDFVSANNVNKKHIHVMVINAGMINSDTMAKKFDTSLFDSQHDVPFDAIQAIRPFVIIDEPHKFPTAKKTWANIGKLGAQYIIRYGATFSEGFNNLLYRLTAVDAFNDDLVKGIDAFIEDMVGDDTTSIKLLDTDGTLAQFELNSNGNKSKFSLAKGEPLSKIHDEVHDLNIENLNKAKVVLTNGIEMNKGDRINPYSYADTLQDNMIQKAIKEHFKIEREFLTQSPRIKPLTLFFIDDIKGYRDGNEISGSLKKKFEQWILTEAKKYLKTETNPFYKVYLEKTIKDISRVHGGYFSKDNSGSDEKIEQEITEILHDKELLLSLENPRRFVFSKWTLREGWDNPNVFQICKLRSSGSSTSKLQEVGRGLRLPVNEYMSRVKGREFRLNYFVDFTEKDFVKTLIHEVNSSSYKEEFPSALDDTLKDKIISAYDGVTKRQLANTLYDDGLIDDDDNFTDGGYDKIKMLYPKAFKVGVKKGKIKVSDGTKTHTKMRHGKYEELKELWGLINQKAILEYKVESEDQFAALFKEYLKQEAANFKKTGVHTTKQSLYIHENSKMASHEVYEEEDDFTPISTMNYQEFLVKLSQAAFIKASTLHKSFIAVKDELHISDYLNIQTVRKIKSGFSRFLLMNAYSKFQLGYQKISNSIHPTKFTDSSGNELSEVLASDIGVMSDSSVTPVDNYLFEDVFYDSELEKENILQKIQSVTVFSKIPKNSIKIPVAGGYSYSPDFAYVVETLDGQTLNFIIETKNVDGEDTLRKEEGSKIKHAGELFKSLSSDIQINFQTQFSQEKIAEIINNNIESV